MSWEKLKVKYIRLYRKQYENGWLVMGRFTNNQGSAEFVEFVEDPEHTWEVTEETVVKESKKGIKTNLGARRMLSHHSIHTPFSIIFVVSSGDSSSVISMHATVIPKALK